MYKTNHRIKLLKRKLSIIIAAVLLVITINPQAVHADEIEDRQLAEGDYVEGEVIAAVRINA